MGQLLNRIQENGTLYYDEHATTTKSASGRFCGPIFAESTPGITFFLEKVYLNYENFQVLRTACSYFLVLYNMHNNN